MAQEGFVVVRWILAFYQTLNNKKNVLWGVGWQKKTKTNSYRNWTFWFWSLLTTFSGNLCPGKYLIFSCVSLIVSVNFLPFRTSSNTYIVTRSSNSGNLLALTPTILAIAEPLQLKKTNILVYLIWISLALIRKNNNSNDNNNAVIK